jgi:hypothetical protein
VTLCALAAALLFLFVPRRWALAAPAVVLVYLAAAHRPVDHVTQRSSVAALHAGIQTNRDWIDRAVGSDADVSILFYANDALPYWENEFFNASVRRAYTIPGHYDGLPEQQVSVSPSGLVKAADGAPVRTPYVLANQALQPVGTKVAADRVAGMSLYRVPSELRLLAKIDGIYPDSWSGPSALYTRYACRRGTVTVRLLGDRQLAPHGQIVVASMGGEEVARTKVPPNRAQLFTVPVKPTKGTCAVPFTVTPTAVPAQAIHSADARELGIRFTRFVYRARAVSAAR